MDDREKFRLLIRRETLGKLLQEAECEDIDEYLEVLSSELERGYLDHADQLMTVFADALRRIERLKSAVAKIKIAPSEEA